MTKSLLSRVLDATTVMLVFAAALVGIDSFHDRTPVCFTILAILAVFCAARWPEPRHRILGMAGAIIGPLVEWLAIRSELWTYRHSDFFGLPLWTVPMWWMFPVAVVRIVELFTHRSISPPALQLSLLCIAAVVPAMCLLGNSSPLLAFAVTVILGAYYLYRRTLRDLPLLIICALIGASAEIFMVAINAWSYPASAAFGLPIWLPTGYSVFGAGLVGLGLGLDRLRTKVIMNPSKSRFSPNLTNAGRILRGAAAIALFVAGWFAFGNSPWIAAALAGFGAFVLFEALRGWCVLRACGIKTRV